MGGALLLLTVQLPDADLILVGEVVLQGVTHRALVVWPHDGLHGRRVGQTYGVAELVHGHREQVHPMRVCGQRQGKDYYILLYYYIILCQLFS